MSAGESPEDMGGYSIKTELNKKRVYFFLITGILLKVGEMV